jgi:hypothetical protein
MEKIKESQKVNFFKKMPNNEIKKISWKKDMSTLLTFQTYDLGY